MVSPIKESENQKRETTTPALQERSRSPAMQRHTPWLETVEPARCEIVLRL